MTDQVTPQSPQTEKPKLRTRTVAEGRELISHLKINGWTLSAGIVTLVILVALVLWYSGLPSYINQHPPNWWFFGLAAVVAYGQYVGYTISLKGAAEPKLPTLRTFELEVAEAVTYTYTPESVGSLALSVRFLLNQKMTSAQAAAATGLGSTITTLVGAIILPIAALLAASTINASDLKKDTPSSTWEIILGVLVVAVIVTLLIKAPTLREKVVIWLKQAWKYLLQVIRQPRRGLQIAAGEFVSVTAQVTCMTLLLLSLHATPRIAALVVITQIAGLAASVVPIPGGLGAPEAILVAGLNAIGVHQEAALICAMSYRMLTYWLPPIPGAVALFDLYREELI